MSQEEWDPLAITDDIQRDTMDKRLIRNILASYTSYFDPFSELFQNALDAVEKRQNELEESEYVPEIWVEVNMKDNFISVKDNGIGFDDKQFKSFLLPNISFKPTGKTRGNKGVGATYLAYGFNHIELGTNSPNYSNYAVLKNGKDWAVGKFGDQKPMARSKKSDNLSQLDRGSFFKIRFNIGDSKDRDLTWYGASTAEQWDALFRVHTPLGGIFLKSESNNVKYHMNVIDQNGNKSKISNTYCNYLYPHELISKKNVQNLGSIINTSVKQSKSAKGSINDLPFNMKNLLGIYQQWSYDDVTSNEILDLKLDAEMIEKCKKYKPGIYGFFTRTSDTWKQIGNKKYNLRAGTTLYDSGVRIAITKMVQGDKIVIPLTRHTGYKDVAHIIIEIEGATPDYGRKKFQPEVEKFIAALSVKVLNFMTLWRDVLKHDIGTTHDIFADTETFNWIHEQVIHAQKHPLKLTNDNFFKPMKSLPILSEPLNEQDVIVLFSQLIAGGVIRGIRIMATNSHRTYDGLFRYFIDEPFKNHEYDYTDNPLGLTEPNKSTESRPQILEYKFDLDSLYEDFKNEEKSVGEIDLVVCWTSNNKYNKKIISLLNDNNTGRRQFHGCTHVVLDDDGKTAFNMIILSELINHLNDPEKSQMMQSTTYSDQ